MSSTDNPPSLALSDIMYHMSPSPPPQDEDSGLATNTNDFGSGDISKDTFISSEPQSSQDVAGIRRRLNELGFSVVGQSNSLEKTVDSVGNVNMSPREKELLDMVISLSQAVAVDPSQLERQAETIANLTTHRDFLAGQIEEERERWQSERDSWDRTAEALISQRNKPIKSEDIERVRASYESENRNLRNKLQDSQKRLSSLESEITRLKPLLFLQPFSISRQDKGKGREFVPKSNLVSIPEDTEMNETQEKAPYYHHYQSQSQSKITNSPATPSTSKPTSATQSTPTPRRSRDYSSYSKSLSKRHCPTLTSDAYTEHLLLAAKRIGRKRASVVAGIMQHTEREKEVLVQEQEQIRSQKEQEKMEQDRQERIASGAFGAYYRTGPEASTSSPQRGGQSKTTPVPRTPKRNAVHYSNMGTGSGSQISTSNMESSLVYVNVNTATSSYDSPWAGSGVMGTPGQIKSALNRQNGRAANSEKGMASNPTTPLASLLDAAMMMNEDGRAGTKQRGKLNGKGRVLEEPESPVPKRRKTSSAGKPGAGGLDRVKSALDVLADQADQAAAAFNETDQSDKRPSSSKESETPTKGKGKAKENLYTQQPLEDAADVQDGPTTFGQELIFVTSTGRGRPRRDSAATTKRAAPTTPTATPSRPVRQASRKQAAPPDHNAAPPTPASMRGSARARGRPRGSASKSGPGNSDNILGGGVPRMISPPGPRVITHATGYSPLDEALAMSNTPESGGVTRDRSRDHARKPYPSSVPDPPGSTEPKIGGNRSVTGWGTRNPPTLDSDSSSPMRGIEHEPAKHKDPSSAGPSSNPPEPLETVTISRSIPEIATHQDVSSTDEPLRPTNGDTHVQDRLPSPSPRNVNESTVDDPDAHAEDDPDAEGEQEEEEEGEDEDAEAEAESDSVSTKHRSRSKSPPPPDPPPPSADNGAAPPDQNDDHDTDADAEGEMDLEDLEDPSQGGIGSTSASSRKATIVSDNSLDLALQFLSTAFFLFSYVTPSFHRHVPTPIYQFDSTATQPPQVLPDISGSQLSGLHKTCGFNSDMSVLEELHCPRNSINYGTSEEYYYFKGPRNAGKI